jgi:hypothetical protein
VTVNSTFKLWHTLRTAFTFIQLYTPCALPLHPPNSIHPAHCLYIHYSGTSGVPNVLDAHPGVSGASLVLMAALMTMTFPASSVLLVGSRAR